MGLTSHGVDAGGDYQAGWQATPLRTGESQVVASIRGTVVSYGDDFVSAEGDYDTAGGLDVAAGSGAVAAAVLAGASVLVLSIEGGDFRYTLDGSTPTAAPGGGHIMAGGKRCTLPYSSGLANMKIIVDNGTPIFRGSWEA